MEEFLNHSLHGANIQITYGYFGILYSYDRTLQLYKSQRVAPRALIDAHAYSSSNSLFS